MVLVDNINLELYILILTSLLAFSASLPNNLDDLHNQLNDNQQKRASGFVPMRGRKSDDEFSNNNAERNLEEQLNIIDQTYPSLSSQQTNDGPQFGLHRPAERTGYEPFRRLPMINSRSYSSNQITPFLSLMSRYGSAPKRAGFVPMRGRKSDPNVQLVQDYPELFNDYSFKRAGFLPMRGKKTPIDLDYLDQFNQKRAFHALRG